MTDLLTSLRKKIEYTKEEEENESVEREYEREKEEEEEENSRKDHVREAIKFIKKFQELLLCKVKVYDLLFVEVRFIN